MPGFLSLQNFTQPTRIRGFWEWIDFQAEWFEIWEFFFFFFKEKISFFKAFTRNNSLFLWKFYQFSFFHFQYDTSKYQRKKSLETSHVFSLQQLFQPKFFPLIPILPFKNSKGKIRITEWYQNQYFFGNWNKFNLMVGTNIKADIRVFKK